MTQKRQKSLQEFTSCVSKRMDQPRFSSAVYPRLKKVLDQSFERENRETETWKLGIIPRWVDSTTGCYSETNHKRGLWILDKTCYSSSAILLLWAAIEVRGHSKVCGYSECLYHSYRELLFSRIIRCINLFLRSWKRCDNMVWRILSQSTQFCFLTDRVVVQHI